MNQSAADSSSSWWKSSKIKYQMYLNDKYKLVFDYNSIWTLQTQVLSL